MSAVILHFCLLLLAAAYAVIGVQVQLINRDSWVNRLFMLTCVSLSLWSLGYAFMSSGINLDHANGWRMVAALGWSTFYVHWFGFVIHLTGTPQKKASIQMGVLYVPTVLFFMSAVFANPHVVMNKTAAGWLDTGYQGFSEYMFIAYYVSVMAYSLWLLHRWQRTAIFIRERKQATIIKKSVMVAFGLGAATDSLLPMMGVVIFPMGIIFIAGCMVSIWYAIARYKLMTVNVYFLSEHILKAVGLPILVLDDQNKVYRCNESACRLLCMQQDLLLGMDIKPLIQSTTGELHGIEGQLNRFGDEINLVNIQGETVRCMMTLTVLRDEFGDVLGKAVILTDLSHIKEAEEIVSDYNKYLMQAVDKRTEALALFNEQLKVEAEERKHVEEQIANRLYYDALTLLPNRLYFKERIAEWIGEAPNTRQNVLAVLFMDLDDFKYINDSLGHYVGDELLKKVAVRLKELVWGHYLVARNGGDEFLIMIDDLEIQTAIDTLEKITAEIIEGFRRPFHVAGKTLFVTASMGTSLFPQNGNDFDHLVRHADMALFEAKQAGKNRVNLSSAEMMAKMSRKAYLRNELHKALDQDELMLYYQPQVSTQTQKIIGFEALLRWKLPDGTFISPAEFVPLAEETGLIIPIGEWVIEQAGKKLSELHDRGYTHLTMAVNVSINQIKQSGFVKRVENMIEKTGVLRGYLEFEITERVGLHEFLEADHIVNQIQKLGVKISIDDFGTEYSSFMTVKRLQINKIKIAMEFVQGIGHSKKDEAIVRTITRLGSILDMHVIAEGVENSEQLDFIKKIQCDSVQGYYFYRPMDAEQLDMALKNEDGIGS